MAGSNDTVTMNVSLPAPLKRWVDEKVASGVYGTASEFVRETLREKFLREQELADARVLLAEKLVDALGDATVEFTDQYIPDKKRALIERHKKRTISR